jgi:hypothetical protein
MDPNPSPFSSNPDALAGPGWWSRNWKWFVPTGCLTVILLALAFVGVITLIVFSALKSTDVYKSALAQAKDDPEVTEALGSPLEEGWFMSGSTHVEGPSGHADIAIPISGPKGKGTIYAVADKSAGHWGYSTLEVEVKQTGNRIDLLHESGEQPQ